MAKLTKLTSATIVPSKRSRGAVKNVFARVQDINPMLDRINGDVACTTLMVDDSTQNIIDTARGGAVGDNNASLGTAATMFGITPNAHGSGIADAAINTFVNKIGGDIITTIIIDLHGGLASGSHAGDVIGTDGGAANAYIAELTSAVNGIPYSIEIGCLEAPTGGDPDINLDCSATATDAENAAVTSGTEILNSGDWALGMRQQVDAGATLAALSKKYLYLTCGSVTEAAYTAGKLVIKIYGVAVDYANS